MGGQVRRVRGRGAGGRQRVGQADHVSAGGNKRLALDTNSSSPGEQGVSRAGAACACRTATAVHKQLGLGREVCTQGGDAWHVELKLTNVWQRYTMERASPGQLPINNCHHCPSNKSMQFREWRRTCLAPAAKRSP